MFFAVVSDHYLHSELKKYIWANYLHYSYSVIVRAITVIIQITALGERGLINVNWGVCNFKQHQSDRNIKEKKGRMFLCFQLVVKRSTAKRTGEQMRPQVGGQRRWTGEDGDESIGPPWACSRPPQMEVKTSDDLAQREKLIRAGQTGDWFSPQQGGYQEPTHQCHGLIGWQRWWKGWKIWDFLRWMWQ